MTSATFVGACGTVTGSCTLLDLGAGVIQFNNFSLIAALGTPATITAMSGVTGVSGVYPNSQLQYLLAEGVPSIQADAVHTMGITGKGVGIAVEPELFDVTIRKGTVVGFETGIFLADGATHHLKNLITLRNVGTGIHCSGNTKLEIVNCRSRENGGIGILLENCQSARIEDCVAQDNADSGIVLGGGGVSGIVVRNNVFAFNRGFGIEFDDDEPTRVANLNRAAQDGRRGTEPRAPELVADDDDVRSAFAHVVRLEEPSQRGRDAQHVEEAGGDARATPPAGRRAGPRGRAAHGAARAGPRGSPRGAARERRAVTAARAGARCPRAPAAWRSR